MIPGEIVLAGGEIPCNVGRKTVELTVTNTDDRPIAVGSHFHFFEVNRFLAFDRELAYGCRLDIPSGTSLRFEPGETREVRLVELGGQRVVYGHNGLTDGGINGTNFKRAMDRARLYGFVKKEAGER